MANNIKSGIVYSPNTVADPWPDLYVNTSNTGSVLTAAGIRAAVQGLRHGNVVESAPIVDPEMRLRQKEIKGEIIAMRRDEFTRDKLEILQVQCAIIGHDFGGSYHSGLCVYCGSKRK